MAVTKRFSRELFNETDKLAKDSVRNLFKDSRYIIKDNPKKLQVDLLIYNSGDLHLFNIETEIKKYDWTTNNFKWESIQLPQRKKKYCELSTRTLFIIWNKDQTAYVAFWDKDVLSSPLVEVPNKYNWKGEHFYQIPISNCVQDKLVDKITI